jgi:hypothetical protein
VAKDTPAVLLPNGHILFSGSSEGSSGWGGPTNFYDVDPTANPITFTTVPSAPNNAKAPYEGRMMMLPTGQAVYTQGSGQLSILNAVAATITNPVITAAPAQATSGSTFTLSGTGLTGVSQTVGYGDDASQNTSYPLVRLTSSATPPTVTYARTHDHSTMAVGTGSTVVTTQVTLPASLANGVYTMEVVTNGVASATRTITVGTMSCSGCLQGNTCEPGNTNDACGSGGGMCQACPSGTSCNSSGVCVAAQCTGCLDGSGQCQPGTSNGACGSGGGTCQSCTGGTTCNGSGVCACTSGCVDGAGQCHAGNTNNACGANGGPCQACASNQTCNGSGTCALNCNGSGCLDSNNRCEPGNTVTFCGSSGNACVACTGGKSCVNGACVVVSTCSHSKCTTGKKLAKKCDPCVTQICTRDSYCCNNQWDSICVGEVASICGQTCN